MSNTQDAKKATMQDRVRKLLAQAEDRGRTAQGRDAGSRANLGTNTRLAGSRAALGA